MTRMIKTTRFSLALAMALLTATAVHAEESPQSTVVKPPDLSKDQQDSCETLLCLAGGQGLAECAEPLKRYYDMKKKYRNGYLSQCPKD